MELRAEGFDVDGYFYNPNIQPYTEYMNRLEAARKLSEALEVRLICDNEYDPKVFPREVAFREHVRCRLCYYMRFKNTAAVAKNGGYDCFTSTLLISPHQEHDLIRSVGDAVAEEMGIELLYRDYRARFKDSYGLSRRYGLYRQQYCGCIYSEHERYASKQERKRTGRD
jgi:predicted adenine nucleotide alpha hydrolase (AANH) superfamily ATPase